MSWSNRYASESRSTYTAPSSTSLDDIEKQYRGALAKHDPNSIFSHQNMLELATTGTRISGQMCNFRNGKPRRKEYLQPFNLFRKRIKDHESAIEELDQLAHARNEDPDNFGWIAVEPTPEGPRSTRPPVIEWEY